jgi:predicted outer membrane repeat protein
MISAARGPSLHAAHVAIPALTVFLDSTIHSPRGTRVMNPPILQNRQHACLWLCALACAAACPQAGAACPPVARTVYVGNDSQCDYDNIQDAIYAATCPETIVVASSGAGSDGNSYYLQHLIVVDKSLTISGRVGGCGLVAAGTSAVDDAPPAQITLDARNEQGTGANNHPVFTIAGNSNVTLRNLEITGANYVGGNGGGLGFEGTGSLTLDNVAVSGNNALNGAGIDFKGTGDADHVANLTLDGNTLILGNKAGASGGGVRIAGQARLIAIEPQTTIFHNQAPNGDGGGIAVVAPAAAYIGSSGYNGTGVLEWNTALNGGGLALASGDGQYTCAQFFTTDPAHPVGISNNSASGNGGAIYVQGAANGSGAHLEISDFRIDGNVATDGSAIYAGSQDSFVSLSHSGVIGPPSTCLGRDSDAVVAVRLSVACAKGVTCSEMSGNGTQYPNGDPSDGATLALVDYGVIHGHGVQLRHNQAANLMRITGGAYSSSLDNLLLADNTVDQALLRLENNAAGFYITSATIAGNAIAHGAVVRAVEEFSLLDSIVDQPGSETLDYTGELSKLFTYYVLTNDASTLPAGTTREGEPRFVDAANGDYHLLPSSLGVDYAPSGSEIADLDGHDRTIDLPQVDNWYGPLDLGAYERQSMFVCDDNADALFCNGFETQP